ncbi:MAG TPA: hypothetical protein VFB80_22795 [Pirellulaceae bacterium]|nr:hypothetical protein [Pirellulaceae bacterium]
MNDFRGKPQEGTVDFARWLDRGLVAAVLLSSAVALSLNVADPDLWGHVQYGNDLLRHGLPRTTTYSYVAQGYPWINHEIVSEIALAIGADLLGGSGLLIGKCLLGVGLITVILWRTHKLGSSFITTCSVPLLVAVTLANHWSLRPQLASYVCFALLLGLLTYCFHGWEGTWQLSLAGLRRRKGEEPPHQPLDEPPLEYSSQQMKLLWLAAPLFMVWTNAHGGFLAGLCVFLAYLGFRGLEAYSKRGREAEGLLRRFGLMAAAAVGATFLNPYGPFFHFWLAGDLSVPRPEIVEWQAPSILDLQFLPFVALTAAGIAAIVLTKRPRDFTHLAILALILWQALMHHRHIAFLAIAAGWWLPLHFDSLLERLGVQRRFKTNEELKFGWAPPESSSFTAAFSPQMQQAFALVLVLAICIATGQLTYRLTTLKVDKDNYPVTAFGYIARRGLTGKMVCTFNWAQYALAAFGAREADDRGIQVQIDGRCRTSYSQEMLDMHFDFLMGRIDPSLRYRSASSGPLDPTRVLRVERPDLVLISRLQVPSVEAMESQKDKWVLLYQDSLAQLWGRRSKYDDPASAFYLPMEKREVGESIQRGFVRWPAVPPYQPQNPPPTPLRAVAAEP